MTLALKTARVTKVRRLKVTVNQTYNLNVDRNHNFYANGILVHNCIDDPHNVKSSESAVQREKTLRTWDETLPTRLNDPEHGAFVVIMQRVHENDLTGHILSKEMGWTHLCLPARFEEEHPLPLTTQVRISRGPNKGQIWFDPRQDGEPLWKERFTNEILTEWEGRLGSYASAGQLQQRPAPREGGMFKVGWFQVVSAAPSVVADRVRAWDFAATAKSATASNPDWTVGVRMSLGLDGVFYIEDVVRFRDTPGGVDHALVAVAHHDRKSTRIRLVQDPGQAGKSQAAYHAKLLAGFNFKHMPAQGSKESWASPLAAQFEAGNIVLVDGPWVREFVEEFLPFPNGSHDDQIDATAQAFDAIVNRDLEKETGKKRRHARTARTFAGAW